MKDGKELDHSLVENAAVRASHPVAQGGEIFCDRQIREDLVALRHHGHSEGCYPMRFQAGDPATAEENIALDDLGALRLEEPTDRARRRRFSCSIGAEEGDDGALLDHQTHVENPQRAVRIAHSQRSEFQRHRWFLPGGTVGFERRLEPHRAIRS